MRFLCFEINYVGFTKIPFFINKKIKTLLKESRKIEAIKLYRSHKNVGLKLSKEYVDKIEHRMLLKGKLETSFINRCKNHENTLNCY